MFCRNCGNKLADNVNFCTKCGTKVNVIENNISEKSVSMTNQTNSNVGMNYNNGLSQQNQMVNQQPNNNLINSVSSEQTKKKSNNIWIILIILFLILIVILIIIFGKKLFNKETYVSEENSNVHENVIVDDVEDAKFVTKFNNYNVKINMEMGVAGVSTKMQSSGTVDEVNQKEYLEVTTTTMGLISVSNKVYQDYALGYTYMTQPYGGDVWYKEKTISQTVDLNLFLNKLNNMTDVTLESENHYKIKMTSNDIMGLLSTTDTDISSVNGDIYVDVYTEGEYIVKMEYDFTELIPAFDSFTTTIEFSNYDNAGNVEIPQSVIDNALEQ